MNFRLCTFASGSEGNVSFLEYGETRLLIDAGASYRSVCGCLEALQLGPEDISALLLTHEHRDHTVGLPMLLKKLEVPVYTTAGTFEGLSSQKLFERLPKARFRLIRPGETFAVGELAVTALPVPHDAKEPVAYRMDGPLAHAAVVTDLGCFDEALIDRLQGLNALVLEANHNPRMLETGPYPYPLKLRIDSDRGHLSNESAAALLQAICHPALETVLLGHLSRTNNYPFIALETVRSAMKDFAGAEHLRILAAPPKGLSEIVTLQTMRQEENNEPQHEYQKAP